MWWIARAAWSCWNVSMTMSGSNSGRFLTLSPPLSTVSGIEGGAGLERLLGDRVEAHGVAGGLDVVRDVRRLAVRLVGPDLELLDERRVAGADQQRHERPQADGDDRIAPAPPPDVDDEQPEREQRDDQQQVDGRQLGVDVGVGGAVDHAPGREVELVALEPVVGGLDQGEQSEQDRQVGLDLRRDPLGRRALHPDAAAEVVRGGGDDQHDDQRHEQPVHREGQERELEDVEPDVDPELRVLDAEVDPVAEQDPGLPLGGDARAGDDREHHGDHEPHRALPTADDLVVPLEELLVGSPRTEPRSDPLGDRQADEHDQEEHAGEDQAQTDLHPEQGAEDRPEARARRTRGSRCRSWPAPSG